MKQAIPLATYVAAESALLAWIWRSPKRAIWVLLLLLPLHTLAMVLVFHFLHPSKSIMSIYQGWKDAILALGLVRAATLYNFRQHIHVLDVLMVALAVVAVLSIPFHPGLGIVNQLLALRNDYLLIPFYFLGRLTPATFADRGWTVLVLAGVSIAATAAGVVERFVDPLQLLAQIELAQYLKWNFHIVSLTYLGLPYSYFQANEARRIGSFFLTPVGLASAGALALGPAAGLLHRDWRSRYGVRLGVVTVTAGILGPILAAGRLDIALLPVLIALLVLLTRRWLVGMAALTLLGVLLASFSVTFYARSYFGDKAGAPAAATAASPSPSRSTQSSSSAGLTPILVTKDESVASHLDSLRTAGRLAISAPLGEGLNTAGTSAARSDRAGGEGQLLVVMAGLGLPGILLALAIMGCGLGTSYRLLRQGTEPPIAAATLVLMVGTLLSLPIVEILSNLFVVAAAFWFLGQAAQLDVSTPASVEAV